MYRLAIDGIYHNGIIIPQETVPYESDMQVIITFIKKIPKREIYVHSEDIQKALKKANEHFKAGKFKEYDDIDNFFEDLNRGH